MATSIQAKAPARPMTRKGMKLVIPREPSGRTIYLPLFCVKCGAPANGTPVQQDFNWRSPEFDFDWHGLPVGLIVNWIAARFSREKMRIAVPFCVQHARKRKRALALVWALFLATFVGAALVYRMDEIGWGWISLVVPFGLAWMVFNLRAQDCSISLESIDEDLGVFSGFSEGFLRQFQPVLKRGKAGNTSHTSPDRS